MNDLIRKICNAHQMGRPNIMTTTQAPTQVRNVNTHLKNYMQRRNFYNKFDIIIDGCATPIIVDATIIFNGDDFELADYDATLGDTRIAVQLDDVYTDEEIFNMLETQCPLELDSVLKNAKAEYWEDYEGDREYRNIVNNEYERL